MTHRFIYWALPLVVTTLLGACSKPNSPTLPAAQMEIVPGEGVGPIKFGMTMDEVKRALGEPDKIPGRAVSYSQLGIAVLPSSQDGRVGAIMIGGTDGGPLVERFQGSTKQGIRLKSTLQQVITAYGTPEISRTDAAGIEELRYEGGRIQFRLQDGKLVHIALRR